MEPFLGQVIAVAFNFVPVGWFPCDGRTVPIQDNQALFSLLGTTYGGDGVTTFGLPDLRGRAAISFGQGRNLQNYVPGQMAGTEQVTLTTSEIASHAHAMMAASDGTSSSPVAGAVLGTPPAGAQNNVYVTSGATTTLAAGTISPHPAGGGMPHDNRQPHLAVTYIISANGIYPSRT